MIDVARKERMIRFLKDKIFHTRFSWREGAEPFSIVITYPTAPWGCEDICEAFVTEKTGYFGSNLTYRLKFTNVYKNNRWLHNLHRNSDGSIDMSSAINIVSLIDAMIKEYENNEVKNMDENIKVHVRGLESLQIELKARGIESSLYNVTSDPTLSVKYLSKAKYTFCTVKEVSEQSDLRYKYDVNVVWPFNMLNNTLSIKNVYTKSDLVGDLNRVLSLGYVEILKPALLLLHSSSDEYDTAYEEMKGIKKIKGVQYNEFKSKAKYDAKLIGTGSYVTWCCDNIARYSAGADRMIKDVIFNDPATIVFWYDGSKTVVKAHNEKFDPEKGLAMAISKKFLGNEYSYYELFNKYVGRYQKKNKKNKKNKKESNNGKLH